MRDKEWETRFLDLLYYCVEKNITDYFSVSENTLLCDWLEEQKTMFWNNELNDYQIFLLNLIKFNFFDGQTEKDEIWLTHFQELLHFYREHNHLNIPKDYTTNTNINLHSWLHMQKQRKRQNQLQPYQIQKLESLNIKWIAKKEKQTPTWNMMYQEAEKYYQKNHHLLISRSFITKNGVELGKWVCEQRDNYLGIGRRKLKDEEIKKLEKIGMYWGSLENGRWEFFLSKLRSYASENTFPMDRNLVYDNFALAKQLRVYLSKPDKDKMKELNRIKPKNLNWFM